jgi:hypothetical protein
MGDAFRRLFLGLGIALGLASGQPDPSIAARVSIAEAALGGGPALVVDARLENAFAPGALELVETGTRVALRYTARLEGPGGPGAEASEVRSLWYDMRSSRYGVSFDGGKTAAMVDPQAARNVVSELRGLELCRAADAAIGARVVVRAEIGILDARGEWHDAPVLWNYYGPRAVLSLDALPATPAPAAGAAGAR